MPEQLLIEDEPAPHVRRLTLNRPERLNTMTAELCGALHAALERDRSRPLLPGRRADRRGPRLLRRAGPRGYGRAPGNTGEDESRDRLANQQHMSRLVLALRALPQPVIAAVNGPSAGFGLALALGCDIRFAAEEAVFRVAFVNIGVSNCDMGTSWLLPRLIGASRSHELMLTGRRVDAQEALRIGLVADVVSAGRARGARARGGEQIAELAPWGVQLTKQGMWTALEIPSEQAAVEYEDRQQIMSTFGLAPPEAISAFLEKRPAEFAD